MNIKENRKHIGIFQIWEIDKYTKKKKQIDEIHNLITNLCLEEEAKILLGTVPDLEIKYLGIGTDSTAPAATDTTLGTEAFRTYRIGAPTYTATGIITTEFYITDSECNGIDIQEIGIFAGSLATSTFNTGTLISHVLWAYGAKSSSIELFVRRIDTIS